MPTVMTHAALAVGLGRVFTARKVPFLFWEITAILAMLPDADVVAFPLGIPYAAPLGHRGFTHSLCFAFIVSLPAALACYRYFAIRFWDLWGFFFVVTASHGILDAFTNGGLGIAFFAPFSNDRYFFPWQPIQVSDIGLAFFSQRGLETAWTEFLWVWVPTILLVVIVEIYRRWRRPSTEAVAQQKPPAQG